MQLKWLKKVATVKDDGTIQFDVPGDIKPQSMDFGSGVINERTDDESQASTVEVEEDIDIPPLQIVILIVGTRGDVQPFIAIGKRLQVNNLRTCMECSLLEFLLTSLSINV